ncbi:phosphatase PAP2 family protein [Nocardioides sp. Kera G14]|uniref:phosphatase PAP2 family protein n=1 Tax=Nocardioides sp. Kera G14 TaxID=2884264 RepID=UPI001D105FEF|nr:phosphatase PAP2 family protein [Nocardioides sp. Kera G14]UDY23226.1 phosphatase PAP2 family protein [Nocardioides sp. Kera G14]
MGVMSVWDELPWPSWDQAAIASVVAVTAGVAVRRLRPSRASLTSSAALLEFALISALYSIWRIARELPFTHEDGAIRRAREIDRLQHHLHLPSEIGLQHFALRHEWLAHFANAYYGTVHVPFLIAFLVWLWIWQRDRYPHWRNGLAYVTLGCLIIRFVRVAPPRFLPELHFVDLASRMGFAVYGSDPSAGVSDQYAAMPSIHVAWAAVVAFGVLATATGRWRWLRWMVFLHLPLTMYAVAATGNHWWLDGIVALALLGIGLVFDSWVRRRLGRPRPSDAGAVEVLEAA